MSSSTARAAPTEVDALRDAARAREFAGDYVAAGDGWAEVTRRTREPLMFLFADAAWTRAFERDGDVDHLCASLRLSEWFVREAGVAEEDRAAVAEMQPGIKARLDDAGGCPAERTAVPLFIEDTQRAVPVERSPTPPPATDGPTPMIEASAEARPWKIAGGVSLGFGSLLAATAIVSGIDTAVATRTIADAHQRHVDAGTVPSADESARMRVVYERGETTQTVAAVTGAGAVVMLATGAALMIRGRKVERRGVAVVPAVSPTSAGLTLGGRF